MSDLQTSYTQQPLYLLSDGINIASYIISFMHAAIAMVIYAVIAIKS